MIKLRNGINEGSTQIIQVGSGESYIIDASNTVDTMLNTIMYIYLAPGASLVLSDSPTLISAVDLSSIDPTESILGTTYSGDFYSYITIRVSGTNSIEILDKMVKTDLSSYVTKDSIYKGITTQKVSLENSAGEETNLGMLVDGPNGEKVLSIGGYTLGAEPQRLELSLGYDAPVSDYNDHIIVSKYNMDNQTESTAHLLYVEDLTDANVFSTGLDIITKSIDSNRINASNYTILDDYYSGLMYSNYTGLGGSGRIIRLNSGGTDEDGTHHVYPLNIYHCNDGILNARDNIKVILYRSTDGGEPTRIGNRYIAYTDDIPDVSSYVTKSELTASVTTNEYHIAGNSEMQDGVYRFARMLMGPGGGTIVMNSGGTSTSSTGGPVVYPISFATCNNGVDSTNNISVAVYTKGGSGTTDDPYTYTRSSSEKIAYLSDIPDVSDYVTKTQLGNASLINQNLIIGRIRANGDITGDNLSTDGDIYMIGGATGASFNKYSVIRLDPSRDAPENVHINAGQDAYLFPLKLSTVNIDDGVYDNHISVDVYNRTGTNTTEDPYVYNLASTEKLAYTSEIPDLSTIEHDVTITKNLNVNEELQVDSNIISGNVTSNYFNFTSLASTESSSRYRALEYDFKNNICILNGGANITFGEDMSSTDSELQPLHIMTHADSSNDSHISVSTYSNYGGCNAEKLAYLSDVDTRIQNMTISSNPKMFTLTFPEGTSNTPTVNMVNSYIVNLRNMAFVFLALTNYGSSEVIIPVGTKISILGLTPFILPGYEVLHKSDSDELENILDISKPQPNKQEYTLKKQYTLPANNTWNCLLLYYCSYVMAI